MAKRIRKMSTLCHTCHLAKSRKTEIWRIDAEQLFVVVAEVSIRLNRLRDIRDGVQWAGNSIGRVADL